VANGTTMVVIFVDCCVGVYGTFRTIPTLESYGAGVFSSRQNPYSGKLFLTTMASCVSATTLFLAVASMT
jgi:hypothetical protein